MRGSNPPVFVNNTKKHRSYPLETCYTLSSITSTLPMNILLKSDHFFIIILSCHCKSFRSEQMCISKISVNGLTVLLLHITYCIFQQVMDVIRRTYTTKVPTGHLRAAALSSWLRHCSGATLDLEYAESAECPTAGEG